MKLFRIILPVPDIDRAAAVYAELLGQPGTRVSPGRHYFDCGGTILACYSGTADGDTPAPPCRWAAGQYLYFSAPDVDAAHATAVRLGFAVEPGGVQMMPWGERMFWARDPFSNPVSFVEAGTEFTGERSSR